MKNYVQDGKVLYVAVTHPTSPKSGDPVRVGDFCGVAVGDEGADGKTPVLVGAVVDVSVKAIDGTGNSAIAIGDALYYVDADTPPISKKTSGTLFGYALEPVSAGATDTINVRLAVG